MLYIFGFFDGLGVASGALFGLLMAFGLIFPNALLMFMFVPFPIKAKYFVLIYGLVELYLGFQNNSNVAHFAHLGGMLFGFMIIKYWQQYFQILQGPAYLD